MRKDEFFANYNFIFAALIVVFFIFLLRQISTRESEKNSNPVDSHVSVEVIDVLVPVADIQSGTYLEQRLFQKAKRPKIGLPSKFVKDFEQVEGFYADSLLQADKSFSQDDVTEIRPTAILLRRE